MGAGRAGAVAAVIALAGLTAFAGAGPATAYTSIPVDPITVPGTTLTGGSLDMATAAERARAVGNVVPQGTASNVRIPSTLGQVASKTGGTVMVAATGLFVGFEGANMVMNWAGVDNVGLSALFPDTTVQGYIPNRDAVYGVEGWDGGVNTMTGAMRYGSNSQNNQYTMADVTWTAGTPELVSSGSASNRVYFWRQPLTYTTSVGDTPQTAGSKYEWFYLADGSVMLAGASAIRGTGSTANQPGYQGPGATSTQPIHNIVAVGFSMEQTYGGKDWPQTPQIIYRFPGAANRFDGGDADPLRAWETRWTCGDGAPGGFQRSAQFRENDATIPEYPAPGSCGSSWVAHVEVWEIPVKSDQGTAEKVWEYDPSPEAQQFGQKYPQCTGGGCRLELYRVDGSSQYQLSCFANPELCVNWFQDPARSDNYQCKYAGAAVDLSECFVYAPTFNVMSGEDVLTEKGPQSATETYPYGDPKTGEATTTTPGTSPGTGTQPGTTPKDENCPPPFSWTSLVNPWWYYKAGVCAMTEVFVPTPGLLAQEVSATQTAVMTRPPFSLFGVVQPAISGVVHGWSGGCSDSLANFDPYAGAGMQIPCEPPQTVMYRAIYSVLVIVIVTTTAFAIWHMLVAAIGGNAGEEQAG